MHVRTIFNIVLKILGILFLKEIITNIPQLFSYIYLIFGDNKSFDNNVFLIIGAFILNAVLYIIPIVYLIFRTEYLIDILKLDVGLLDDKVEMNMHRSTVLSITVMVVGGILFVQEIPILFIKSYEYFFYKKSTYLKENAPTYIYFSIAIVILSLFLMIGQRQIVNWIEKQRKK